jgi:hypothetical protein
MARVAGGGENPAVTDGDARAHWEEQADAWLALTRSDPDYELLNKPSFLELVPPPGRLTLDVGCGVLMDVETLDRAVCEIARVLSPRGVLCAAIMHPIFTSGLFVDGDPYQTFSMGAYATTMRHVLDVERHNGERMVFRIEHRPIERYSRALEQAGLAITHIREPVPSEAAVADQPSFANYRRVPEFLHLRAESLGR